MVTKIKSEGLNARNPTVTAAWMGVAQNTLLMNESKLLKVSFFFDKNTLSLDLEIIDENEKNNLENLESEIICSNWISINQFLFDWFLTGSLWLVQFLSDWFRPEAIDMNLCLASFDGSDTAQDVFEL